MGLDNPNSGSYYAEADERRREGLLTAFALGETVFFSSNSSTTASLMLH
jgi:hypothetical protein